jgi:hypothetical protein
MDDQEAKQRLKDGDDGKDWVWITPDGAMRSIPKVPLLMGGFGPPPFIVTLPDGRLREIIHRPPAEMPNETGEPVQDLMSLPSTDPGVGQAGVAAAPALIEAVVSA